MEGWYYRRTEGEKTERRGQKEQIAKKTKGQKQRTMNQEMMKGKKRKSLFFVRALEQNNS